VPTVQHRLATRQPGKASALKDKSQTIGEDQNYAKTRKLFKK
jgi:hypothetical protein